MKSLTVSIQKAPGELFLDHDVDLSVTDAELSQGQPLLGRFQNFKQTEGKWQELSAAAEHGAALGMVQGHRYELEYVHSDGSFKLVAS